MMPSGLLSPAIAKEIRALLPLWLGSLAVLLWLPALGASTDVGGGGAHALGMLLFGGASVALGAESIGHEYTHRTLAQLLSQPATRARLFLAKQSVLAVMLLVLAGAAWGTVFYATRVAATIVVLGVLCGLFIAPWLTMLCRNPLAGAAFPIPIVGWTWLLVDLFVAAPLKVTVFSRVIVGLCAVAAVLGWRKFMRLEAMDGRGTHVHMQWSASDVVAAARRRHPVWSLVRKEAGLQQMTFVVVAIYLLGSLKLFGHLPASTVDLHAGLTAIYSGVLALLIGSLASAQERQYGTLQSQLLLPIASSTQWLVKVGIAFGLAVLLAVALPALIVGYHGRAVRINEWYACAILILTVTSLYVSSLCSTDIKAFLLSMLAAPLVLPIFVQFTHGVRHLPTSRAVMLASFLTLVLWFAFDNHRSAEREASRIGRQVFVMAGCLALGGALLAVL